MITGKIPDGFIYVGSPDTPENARKIFRDLEKNFPTHPAYQGGNSTKDRSEVQKLMKDKGMNVL